MPADESNDDAADSSAESPDDPGSADEYTDNADAQIRANPLDHQNPVDGIEEIDQDQDAVVAEGADT